MMKGKKINKQALFNKSVYQIAALSSPPGPLTPESEIKFTNINNITHGSSY